MSTTTQHAPLVWRAALRWEQRKAHAWWFHAVTALVWGLSCWLGAGQYREYRAEFEAQGVTWTALWAQSSMLPSMFFIPLTMASVVAQICGNEHEGRNWSRMAANQLDDSLFVGKLLHTLGLSVAACLVFAVEFAVTGLLVGFPAGGLVALLPRIVPMSLGLWAISLVTLWLGIRMSSFAGTMTTVFVATIAGLGLTLVVPPLAALYPMSLLTAASGARQADSVTSMGSIAVATIICALWCAVLAMASRRAMKRLA